MRRGRQNPQTEPRVAERGGRTSCCAELRLSTSQLNQQRKLSPPPPLWSNSALWPFKRTREIFFLENFFLNQILTDPWIQNSTVYTLYLKGYSTGLIPQHFLKCTFYIITNCWNNNILLKRLYWQAYLPFRRFETISSAIFRTIYSNSKWSVAPKSGIREKYCAHW